MQANSSFISGEENNIAFFVLWNLFFDVYQFWASAMATDQLIFLLALQLTRV